MNHIHTQLIARSTGVLRTGADDLMRQDRAACAELRLGEIAYWICCKNGTHFLKMPRAGSIGAIPRLPAILTEAVQINVFRPSAHWYKVTVTDTNQGGIVSPTTGDTAIREIQAAIRAASKAADQVVVAAA